MGKSVNVLFFLIRGVQCITTNVISLIHLFNLIFFAQRSCRISHSHRIVQRGTHQAHPDFIQIWNFKFKFEIYFSSTVGTFGRALRRHQVPAQHFRRVGRWRHFRSVGRLRPATVAGGVDTATPRGHVYTDEGSGERRCRAARSTCADTTQCLQSIAPRALAHVRGKLTN